MYLNPIKIAFFSYQHRKNSEGSVILVYVVLSYVFADKQRCGDYDKRNTRKYVSCSETSEKISWLSD